MHQGVCERHAEECLLPTSPSSNHHPSKMTHAEVSHLQKQYLLNQGKPDSKLHHHPSLHPHESSPHQPPLLQARHEAKQRLADLKARSVQFRQESLRLRPRSLPELLSAAHYLGLHPTSTPPLLWLVDVILATHALPATVRKLSMRTGTSTETKLFTPDATTTSLETKYATSMCASERLRMLSHGEYPYYFLPVPNIGDEEHPMATCVKDVSRLHSLVTSA